MSSKQKASKLLLSRKNLVSLAKLRRKLHEMGLGTLDGFKQGGSPSTHIGPEASKEPAPVEKPESYKAKQLARAREAAAMGTRWRRKL